MAAILDVRPTGLIDPDEARHREIATPPRNPISGVAGDPAIDNACSISFFNGGFKRYA
jgi:hypothetical protein